MEDENTREEHNELPDGFPGRKNFSVPQGYFENFPDQVLNRWHQKESQRKTRRLTQRIASVAALVAGLLIGGWFFFMDPSTHMPEPYITSEEAYQYIDENIDEFTDLLEGTELTPDLQELEVPADVIEDYLMEELEGTNAEELF
jgi:hypothetical protein